MSTRRIMKLPLLYGLALLLVTGTSGRAGDEPLMGGKTAGQWIAIFQDNSRSLDERWQAAESLGYLGPAAKSAVPFPYRPSLIRAPATKR